MKQANHDIDVRRLKRLLRYMIDIYSPSGKEEELLDYLHGFFKRQGIPMKFQEVDEDRCNLIVMPDKIEPELVLMGHIDTVVAYELANYGFQIQADTIRGLGSADMKGGCAAMIEAYLVAWQIKNGNLPVALALVVGEEDEGDGAIKFANEYSIPWVVIGEPTALQVCTGSYGYLEAQLIATGQKVHASLARPGKSTVHELLHLLTAIVQYAEQKRPESTVNIRDLLSSQAGYAAPEQCEAWLDIHIPPDIPPETIVTELDELVKEQNSRINEIEVNIRFSGIFNGFSLSESGTIISTLKQIFTNRGLQWKPQIFPSHSDANILWQSGFRPILLGPGQLEQAHIPTESISFTQVRQAAEIYLDLIKGSSLHFSISDNAD